MKEETVKLDLIKIPTSDSPGIIKMHSNCKGTFYKVVQLFYYEKDRRGINNNRTENSLELYANDGTIEELEKVNDKLKSRTFKKELLKIKFQIQIHQKQAQLQSLKTPIVFFGQEVPEFQEYKNFVHPGEYRENISNNEFRWTQPPAFWTQPPIQQKPNIHYNAYHGSTTNLTR